MTAWLSRVPVAALTVVIAMAGTSGAAPAMVKKPFPCVQHTCRVTLIEWVPAGTTLEADFEHQSAPSDGFVADATQTCPATGDQCRLELPSGPLQTWGVVPIALRLTNAEGQVRYETDSVRVTADVRHYCNLALDRVSAALPALRRPALRSKPIPVRLPGRGSADVRASTMVAGRRLRLAFAGDEDISRPEGTSLHLVLDANGRRRATKVLRGTRTLKILVEVRIHTFDGGQVRLGRTFTVKPSASD